MSAVAMALQHAVAALHGHGRVHGDLHPGNVLVREDATVVLIDLEMSYPVSDPRTALIGAPGFVAPDGRSGIDHDLYALACIELFMFVPLIPLLNLDPDKAGALVEQAATQFELDQAWVDRQLAILARRDTAAADRVDAAVVTDAVAGITQALLTDATPDRNDRLWPGDPAQFSQPSTSLAHGALGVLTALHFAGIEPAPQHFAWLQATESGSGCASPRRLGLLDGLSGTIWAYRRIGMHELADRRLADLMRSRHNTLGFDLYGGLPGLGLTLLAESDRQTHLHTRAADIAAHLRERWRTTEPPSQVATGAGGLLHGATGTALFALRLFEATGDPEHLRIATEAIEYDLHSLRAARDGSLQVDEGWRLLPYLGNGSAGIGIVLAQLLSHMPGHSRYLEILDGIARAATAPFTAQSGLFEGRAGLIQLLLTLERTRLATNDTSDALHRHVAALELHALRHGDQVRFAGNGVLRASCDLATGAAGVLATLIEYNAEMSGLPHDPVCVPYLTPLSGGVRDCAPLAAALPLEGGEISGLSPVATGA